jgi:replicative DNA helicase
MDRVLRSVIQIGSAPETEFAYQNWQRLEEHSLEFSNDEDRKIIEYLRTFYTQMASPPDFSIIIDYFEKNDEIEVVSRLEEIKKAQWYVKTNFLAIIKSISESQQVRNFSILCRDAQAIAEHGRNLQKPVGGKKILKGIHDAVNYMYDHMHEFTQIEAGDKLESIVHEDADEIIEDYDNLKKSNQFKDRNLFGFEPIDSVCMGHKPGEYWIHAASFSELKTSLALNYAYNNSYVYGRNIFYAILEMPVRQLRLQLYALHSSNSKFVYVWNKQDGYIGLDYRQMRDGLLNKRDYERLKIVAKDLKETSKGVLKLWRPSEEVAIQDIRRSAEMFHNKYGCNGVIIDHLGLVKPKYRSSDYGTSLNSVVRDARLMALNFARGKSIPVLALFQINRQGKLRADKNDGRYTAADLYMSNEVEKSADVITYTYLNDELRKNGNFYVGNIKNRDSPLIERFVGKIIWQTRRMRAMQVGLLDLDNDQILDTSKKISMTMSDLI